MPKNNNKLKILVVGDVMLDRYLYGSTSRVSPEAPVPVVHLKNTDYKPGGKDLIIPILSDLPNDVRTHFITSRHDEGALFSKYLLPFGFHTSSIW